MHISVQDTHKYLFNNNFDLQKKQLRNFLDITYRLQRLIEKNEEQRTL